MSWRYVSGKRVWICEQHNYVLEAWAALRQEAGHPLHLISFDYHTDTLPAFEYKSFAALKQELGRPPSHDEHTALRARWLAEVDFADSASVRSATTRIRYDEHIDAARRGGVLAAIDIILGCRDPGNRPDFATLWLPRETCSHVQVGKTPPQHDAACERALVDALLEDTHLGPIVAGIEAAHGKLDALDYVLDIDLDYFRSARSASPATSAMFSRLVRHARAITIAREAACVGLLRLKGESIIADDLQAAVLSLIARA